MSIKRYTLLTTINAGQEISLSDIVEIPADAVSRSSTHDLYTNNAVAIQVKIGSVFRVFEAAANGFNRIEYAYLKDIKLVGSVNGTVVELVGSDQKSDT